MKDLIFEEVKNVYKSMQLETVTDESINEFSHKLATSLNRLMEEGKIKSFAVSNINLREKNGPFVRVSSFEDDGWKHYEFSCKTLNDESISDITVKIV